MRPFKAEVRSPGREGNFAYTKLQTRTSIQLLKIEQATDEEIIVSLAEEDISADEYYPAYHALSYCWGEPTRDIAIKCTNSIFGLPEL